MLRASYYQQAGNTNQFHKVPKYRLPFEFPLQGDTHKANDKMRSSILIDLLTLDLLHTFGIFPFCVSFAPELPLLCGFLLALAYGFHAKGNLKTSLATMLGSLAGALLIWVSDKSPLVCLPILALILSLYIYKFGKHWIHRCTLSPLPQAEAAAIRESQQTPLLIYSAMPFLAAAAALVFESFLMFPVTLLLMSLVQFGSTPKRWRALQSAQPAFTSWCAYNLKEVSLPGIFRSPVGPATNRRTFLITSAMSFAYLYAYAAPNFFQGAIHLVSFLCVPAFLFALIPIGILLPLLTKVVAVRRRIPETNYWKESIEACRNSTNPIARQSFYQGQVAADGSPLIVSRQAFDEHVHFLGSSGSGKTSTGLGPWIEQQIAFGDCSIIVIDNKGDSLELPATLAAGADELEERTGKRLPLKMFSSMGDRPTYAFNPMSSPEWAKLTRIQKTDVICATLGLNYGTDYGPSYYSCMIAAVALEVFRLFPNVRNFSELADRCGYVIQNSNLTELHKDTAKEGLHLYEELKRAAECEQLQVLPSEDGTNPVADQAIDLASMFQEPQLLHVHLSSILGASSGPMIARLFANFLMVVAAQVERRCKVYLVIDEFQRMSSKSLDYLLQMARSLDISVVLANQSLEDLKTLKSNLIPAIENNCQYRQWFDIKVTEDIERMMKVSGERVELLSSSSISANDKGTTVSSGKQEKIVPRLSINDILLAGSDEELSIVRLGRNKGYAQYGGFPFIVRSKFHISEEEYEKRRAYQWPEKTEGMMIPNQTTDVVQTTPGPIISREVDGTEDDGSDASPGSLDELFDSLDESPKKRLKKKRGDSKDKENGKNTDDDSTQ